MVWLNVPIGIQTWDLWLCYFNLQSLINPLSHHGRISDPKIKSDIKKFLAVWFLTFWWSDLGAQTQPEKEISTSAVILQFRKTMWISSLISRPSLLALEVHSHHLKLSSWPQLLSSRTGQPPRLRRRSTKGWTPSSSLTSSSMQDLYRSLASWENFEIKIGVNVEQNIYDLRSFHSSFK